MIKYENHKPIRKDFFHASSVAIVCVLIIISVSEKKTLRQNKSSKAFISQDKTLGFGSKSHWLINERFCDKKFVSCSFLFNHNERKVRNARGVRYLYCDDHFWEVGGTSLLAK
jgi:hypothetical protein